MHQTSLFTIGHSNHPIERFIHVLEQHHIQVLADIRSYPYSQHVPQFNREGLAEAMKKAGIKYVYLGEELGGRPRGDDFYDHRGHVLYYKVAQTASFESGIRRLEDGSREFRVAIMCSEEDPTSCHRHLLVSRVAAARGIQVTHIRGDGSLNRYEELPTRKVVQPSLFDDVQEDSSWKSTRSVSRKRPQSNSSDFYAGTASNDLLTSD